MGNGEWDDRRAGGRLRLRVPLSGGRGRAGAGDAVSLAAPSFGSAQGAPLSFDSPFPIPQSPR
jgi:hypothetical protein